MCICRWQQAASSLQWKALLNAELANANWFVRHRNTFGNSKRVRDAMILLYLISTSLSLFFLLLQSLYSSSTLLILLCNIAIFALAVAPWIVLFVVWYDALMYDVWCIHSAYVYV